MRLREPGDLSNIPLAACGRVRIVHCNGMVERREERRGETGNREVEKNITINWVIYLQLKAFPNCEHKPETVVAATLRVFTVDLNLI